MRAVAARVMPNGSCGATGFVLPDDPSEFAFGASDPGWIQIGNGSTTGDATEPGGA